MAFSYSWKELLNGRFELDNARKEAHDVCKGRCTIYAVDDTYLKVLTAENLNLIRCNDVDTPLPTLLKYTKNIAYKLPPAVYYLLSGETANAFLYLGDAAEGFGGTWIEV